MIATTLGEGFGNQMFMYAMAKAMLLRNGFSVSVQNRHLASPLNKCYICAHIKNQELC